MKTKSNIKQITNMKNKILLTLATAALAVSAVAALPNYQTLGPASGTAASPATIIIPADPVLTPRVVTANWQSDSNSAVLSFTAGQGAYVIAGTNLVSSGTSQVVNATNGLSNGSTLVLQKLNGVCYSAVLSSYTQSGGSNLLTLASGGWGAATAIGDSVYQMGTAVPLPVGATTNFATGDAIFVGVAGRPAAVTLTPSLVTNRLNSLTVRFD